MLPSELKSDDFRAYPPEARKLAADSVSGLRRLPLSFLPNLLRELIEYDDKFPAERVLLEKEWPTWRVSQTPTLRNCLASSPKSGCRPNSSAPIG